MDLFLIFVIGMIYASAVVLIADIDHSFSHNWMKVKKHRNQYELAIDIAYNHFNYAEPEFVEASVYEIKMAESAYSGYMSTLLSEGN